MRNQAILVCALVLLPAAGCLSDTDEDLTADEAAALDDELATADDEPTDLAEARVAAAAVPGTPSLGHENLGCSGITARYLISWSAAGATSYDVDYRRGSGAWHDFSSGAAKSKIFSTSDGHTSVSFRARGCNTSGCGAFRTSTFTPFECNGGDPL